MNRLRLVILFLLIACGLAAITWSNELNRAIQSALQFVESMGFWGPLFFVVIYVVGCVLYLPGSLLTIGAGFIFGFVQGTVTVSIGSTLGASAAFLLARNLLRDWVAGAVSQRFDFQALDAAVAREGFKVVLLTRLSPVLPFNLLNFAFGLTKVSFRDYVLASWIGMLPGAVLYIYIGTTIKSLSDLNTGQTAATPAKTAFMGLGLVATLAVVVLLTRMARKALTSGKSGAAQVA